MWREIEAIHTDKLYELMCYADDGGLRETYARAVMHTARIVWNWAQRYLRKEFEFNPFDGMRLETPDARTVRWEPAQVWQFCRTAEEMGLLSAALVAVFCYELGQRPGDARKMCRSCFEGAAIIVVEQGKTGKQLLLPVSDVLAEFVDKVPGDRNELVVNERTGRQYEDYELSKICAEIREAAKLPGHLWIADLRRTCLTELGRLGASDDQLISVSGHSQRQMLSTYSLTEYRKAVDIMQRRRSLRNAA
jgi:integrase